MKTRNRYLLFFSYLISSVGLILLILLIIPYWTQILTDWSFWPTFFLYLVSIEEIYQWAKNSKRSEMSDIIALAFFFFLIFFFTKDLFTAIMGAFSIYLWVGVYELKEYPILNKILIISLITYNFIFIAGIISFYLSNPFYINTAFSFSFWVILGLGLLIFGRKYIVVWRFMSPEYLTLFLYIISWLAISFIDQYTPIDFIYGSPLINTPFNLLNFLLNIYFILIIVNWIVYFISGPVLDKMLGIKKVRDENILNLVDQVKNDMGIKGKVKVGFGNYPILNAMAYGAFFDKRIAIIAEDINQIPIDELKGIVAHELAHTKGKHTLILAFISISDLIFRMILGIPATYYDYTFGNPQMPMIFFILLNIGIYFILYIFVRILEGKADLKSKKNGYGDQLVKALYNLESFYATGREIGLNTMLLCDEKITKDHKVLDYMKTSEYLCNSMINPSRLSLLSNFLNSHPPTYHRIASLLSNDLKPGKEVLLPFICMKKSKQEKYAKKFENARNEYKSIANQKFKELFEIRAIYSFLDDIDRKYSFKYQQNKDFIFKNKITGEILFGKLIDMEFYDDICEPIQYTIKNLKTGKEIILNSSLYSKKPVEINGIYFFQKKNPLTLKSIELNNDQKDGNFIFINNKNHEIIKPIKKTKLPVSINFINNLKDKDVFLKRKGQITINNCINVKSSSNLKDYILELSYSSNDRSQKKISYNLSELIIHPRNINIFISKKNDYRKSEIEIIKWLLERNLRCVIWLKKPVNNYEIGNIHDISVKTEKSELLEKNNEIIEVESLTLKNIFGKIINIPYKIIEQLSFEYDGVIIQKKSQTSYFSKLSYKLIKKFRPETIIVT
ncbi:MAG: M48 family metalloprotease [Promethearchaeota archaeon]